MTRINKNDYRYLNESIRSMNEDILPGGERMRPHPLKWRPNDPGKLGPIGTGGPGLTFAPPSATLGTGGNKPIGNCWDLVNAADAYGCDLSGQIDYPQGSPCWMYMYYINELGCVNHLY